LRCRVKGSGFRIYDVWAHVLGCKVSGVAWMRRLVVPDQRDRERQRHRDREKERQTEREKAREGGQVLERERKGAKERDIKSPG
jgi:hypothetical protein